MMPVDNFFRSAARWPGRVAVEILDETSHFQISYQELAVLVNALAVALQAIDPTPQAGSVFAPTIMFQHLLGWLATYAAGKTGCS